MKKLLNAKAAGEFSYDFKYDTFTFKVRNRPYKQSVEFQNFVADIDMDGLVTGVRIFDASKVFGLEKYTLKDIIKVEFSSHVERGVVTIILAIIARFRNKLIPLLSKEKEIRQQLTTPLNKIRLDDSTVQCAVTA